MHKDIIRNITIFLRIRSLSQFSRHSFKGKYISFINKINKCIQNCMNIEKQILLLKFHEIIFSSLRLIFKLQNKKYNNGNKFKIV